MLRYLLCSLAFLSVTGCTITIQTPNVKTNSSSKIPTPKLNASSEETISLTGVTNMRIAAPLKVTITEDTAAEAVLRVPAEVRERLQVRTQGRDFEISTSDGFCTRSGASLFGTGSTIIVNGTVVTDCLATDTELTLEISSALLQNLTLSNAVEVELNELDEENFVLRASGASEVEFKNTRNIETLLLDLSGASSVQASETTSTVERIQIEASGASEVDLTNIPAKQVTVDISGASDVTVRNEQPVSGQASGASSLILTGNPNHRVRTSGASDVSYR